MQPLAKKVRSYIKDTNHFLKKIMDLDGLPDGAILCTVDVVGLYPSIPHEEGLEALKGVHFIHFISFISFYNIYTG